VLEKTKVNNSIVVCAISFLVLTTTIIAGSPPMNQGCLRLPFSTDSKEGYILYTPMDSTTTYLMNETGAVNHTWDSTYHPRYDAYLLDNGSIMRPFDSERGGVQKIAWDSTVLWEYHYTRDGSFSTHDIVPLPNGDVLMIMQETKSRAQAIQAGRNPNTVVGNFYPDFLIQVHETGPTSGDIVWEWHIWDHLIQDYDATKDNYGDVSEHPELININFGEDFTGDWIHMNSVDYHPRFDQILMSAHNFDEIWVIDHSTTTEEAASHYGGIYNHGGDLLYRWGNPQAYDRGTAADEKLYFEHQSTWIQPGLPGAGNILVFSNGNNRPGGPLSTVDEFVPDVDNNTGEYHLPPGGTYGPVELTWQYQVPSEFYASIFCGAQRMINGNTLVCAGTAGTFLEVNLEKKIVWTYVNPYPNYGDNAVYRTEYIPPYIPPPPPPVSHLACTGNLTWSTVKPGATVYGNLQVRNVGDNGSLLDWAVNNSITWGTWTFTPPSGDNLTPWEGPVSVQLHVVVPKEKNQALTGTLRVENKNNASDYVDISVTLTTSASSTLSVNNPFLSWLFDRFPHAFPILRHLLGF